MPVYKGWKAKIYKDGFPIGHVSDIKVDIDHSLEYYFEAGARVASLTIEGPLNIKGKMGKAWVDTNYLSLLSNTGTLGTFTLALQVNTSVMTLYLYNCKFNKGGITVPQDGFLTEDYDFLATAFAIVAS